MKYTVYLLDASETKHEVEADSIETVAFRQGFVVSDGMLTFKRADQEAPVALFPVSVVGAVIGEAFRRRVVEGAGEEP